MTAQKNAPQEKSVEEILSSIRDIISSDVKGAEKAAAPVMTELEFPQPAFSEAPRPNAPLAEEPHLEDVLELTPAMEESVETESVIPESDIALGDVSSEPEITLRQEIQDDETAALEAESFVEVDSQQNVSSDKPSPSAPFDFRDAIKIHLDVQPELTPEDRKPMLDNVTVSETVAAFSTLKEALSQFDQRRDQSSTTGEFNKMTIEQVVREMLRPMLKEWLDAHLPSLVKWLVAEQIEKMLQQQGITAPKE